MLPLSSAIQQPSFSRALGLETWPFVSALLADSTWRCGLDGDFRGAALEDWSALANRYALDMGRFSPIEIREVAGLTAFRIEGVNDWAVIVHPLWDIENYDGVLAEAIDEIERDSKSIPKFVNTFDLARRIVSVRQGLLNSKRL